MVISEGQGLPGKTDPTHNGTLERGNRRKLGKSEGGLGSNCPSHPPKGSPLQFSPGEGGSGDTRTPWEAVPGGCHPQVVSRRAGSDLVLGCGGGGGDPLALRLDGCKKNVHFPE